MWKSAKSMFNSQTSGAGAGRKHSSPDRPHRPSVTSSTANQSPLENELGTNTNGHGKKLRPSKLNPGNAPVTRLTATGNELMVDDKVQLKRYKQLEKVPPRGRSRSFNSTSFLSDPVLPVPRATDLEHGLPLPASSPRQHAASKKGALSSKQQQQLHLIHSKEHPSRSSIGTGGPLPRKSLKHSYSTSSSPDGRCSQLLSHRKPDSEPKPLPKSNGSPRSADPPSVAASVSSHCTKSSTSVSTADKTSPEAHELGHDNGTLPAVSTIDSLLAQEERISNESAAAPAPATDVLSVPSPSTSADVGSSKEYQSGSGPSFSKVSSTCASTPQPKSQPPNAGTRTPTPGDSENSSTNL